MGNSVSYELHIYRQTFLVAVLDIFTLKLGFQLCGAFHLDQKHPSCEDGGFRD